MRGFFSRGIALRPQLRWRLVGLLVLAIIVFSQPFGLTAADTKHDLAANPLGFLRGALHAYTEVFTLGQLQNQAYGYLFPQGLFFLLTDFLPDWIAQRLWWWLVLGVGFWGFHRLLFAALPSLRQAPGWWPFLAALLYSLSPRALTTLGAISSETWPVMLAPWVVLPFLRRELNWRDAAAAIIPVALMGAVNATATLAACVPAAVVLFYSRAWRPGLAWLAGCAAVSVWWIVPLLVLGRYAPPFTEFIESSFVTTRWLNLPEILRGTTSWAPFVDTERSAGYALAVEPFFVLVTIAVAAVGLYGLSRLPRVWPVMLCVGIAILGTHAAWYLHALDGPLAALRNLHKFDPLVRIPLLLGFTAATAPLSLPDSGRAWLRPSRKQAVAVLVAALACASFSPAWTGRLLPKAPIPRSPTTGTRPRTFSTPPPAIPARCSSPSPPSRAKAGAGPAMSRRRRFSTSPGPSATPSLWFRPRPSAVSMASSPRFTTIPVPAPLHSNAKVSGRSCCATTSPPPRGPVAATTRS
ncbi:hypothetical protein AZH45_04750 [Corynebacterium striatum]|nr:hypothetical protein AZH45_04750 [Corynebacterium striatum]